MTTRSPGLAHHQTLAKFFRRTPVARLVQLQRALGTSGRTVFRALQPLGYLTSYNHAGGYYTLRSIPVFDAHGLWVHGKARFSSHGTLRATVVVLVKRSRAGCTHDELQEIVGLRVHDTLRSLVASQLIGRETIDAVYVYVDGDRTAAARQIAQRRDRMTAQSQHAPAAPLELAQTVEVLVAIIRHPWDGSEAIARRLRRCGLSVSPEQVQGLLTTYGLGKKTVRSRSKPLPRSEAGRHR